MSNEIEDGGAAFPETRWDDKTRQEVQWTGMTLRDYFAAKAMQGMLAADTGSTLINAQSVCANYAYEMAEAMLKSMSK